MSSQIKNTVPLRDIIYLYSESAMQDDTKYLRLWRMAFRGFAQMGLNSFFQPKAVIIDVNDNNTVTFPFDYLVWLKIGVQGVGGIYTLKRNNSLSTSYADGYAIVDTAVYFNNDHVLCYSAGGMPYSGQFDVDETNRCFVFNQDFGYGSVVLQYLGAPEMDGEYEVPIQFQEAFIDWLAWQDVKHIPASSHFGRGDKLDRGHAFKASLYLARRMYKPFRIDDLLEKATSINLPNQPHKQ